MVLGWIFIARAPEANCYRGGRPLYQRLGWSVVFQADSPLSCLVSPSGCTGWLLCSVILATIDILRPGEFYNSIDIGPNGAISLV
jgi:hypothetical protein